MKAHTTKPHRKYKGFRFPADICQWLAHASARTGKTQTRLLEEAVRPRMALKLT